MSVALLTHCDSGAVQEGLEGCPLCHDLFGRGINNLDSVFGWRILEVPLVLHREAFSAMEIFVIEIRLRDPCTFDTAQASSSFCKEQDLSPSGRGHQLDHRCPVQLQISGKLCFLKCWRRLARLRFLVEKYRHMPVPVHPPSSSMTHLLEYTTEKGSHLKLRGPNLCPPEWNLLTRDGVQTLGDHDWAIMVPHEWLLKVREWTTYGCSSSTSPTTQRYSKTLHLFRRSLTPAPMEGTASLIKRKGRGIMFLFPFERASLFIKVF